jgi:hypothetical protein
MADADEKSGVSAYHPALPAAESWDFEQFLRYGIARAQEVSGDVWTDYNEHDPGVTILEQVCYALTDLAYRTGLPTADILASLAESGTGDVRRGDDSRGDHAGANPFHPVAASLSTSAVTEEDFRRLVLSHFPEVRNVWIRPALGGDSHFMCPFAVLLQRSRDPADYGPRFLSNDDLKAGVHRLLQSEACLGMTFLEPELLSPIALPIKADIVLDPADDSDPMTIASLLVFAVNNAIDPQPSIEAYRALSATDLPPDSIYDGPYAESGKVDFTGVPTWPVKPDADHIRRALLHTEGVLSVGQVRLNNGGALPDASYFYVDISPQGLEGLTVTRDGVKLLGSDDAVMVGRDGLLAELNQRVMHRRRQQRFSGRGLSGVRDMDENGKQAVGVRRGELGTYRSIQHLFPAVYGLGQFGDPSVMPAGGERGSRLGHAASEAEINQLRAFLMLFEQPLANYLAQLVNAPRLLSWNERWDRSYFFQPVSQVTEDATGRLVQDPAGSADILLGEPEKPGEPPGNARQRLGKYIEAMQKLMENADPREDRAERAYDHLLARFNERFDNAQLNNLASHRHLEANAVRRDRNEDKRLFLANIDRLGARRGAAAGKLACDSDEENPDGTPVGLDTDARLLRPALAERIERFVGLAQGSLRMIDHGMLGADPLDDGVGEMMVWPTASEVQNLQPVFRVGPAIWSIATAAGTGAERLHFLANPLLAGRFWDVFDAHEVDLEVDPGRMGGRFGARLSYTSLDGSRVAAARSLEDFPSDVEAEFQASLAAEGFSAALHQTGGWEIPRGFNALPTFYHNNRLSAVVPASLMADQSVTALFARTLRQEAPAHLSLDICAATDAELAIADAGRDELHLGQNGVAAARLRRLLARFTRARLFPDSTPAGRV